MEHFHSRLLVPAGKLLYMSIFSNLLISLKHIEQGISDDGSFQDHRLGSVSFKEQQPKLKKCFE